MGDAPHLADADITSGASEGMLLPLHVAQIVRFDLNVANALATLRRAAFERARNPAPIRLERHRPDHGHVVADHHDRRHAVHVAGERIRSKRMDSELTIASATAYKGQPATDTSLVRSTDMPTPHAPTIHRRPVMITALPSRLVVIAIAAVITVA